MNLITFLSLTMLISFHIFLRFKAVSANLENEYVHFQPMVAMLCSHGKVHNQYFNEQRKWVTDSDPTSTCTKDKLEILEYCRKVCFNSSFFFFFLMIFTVCREICLVT